VRVFLPFYSNLRTGGDAPTTRESLPAFALEFPRRTYHMGVRKAPLPGREDEVPLQVEFLDCPELYDRAGYYTSDPDEHMRFAGLCRGALEVCQRTGWAPDVVHCNDWHAGLLPLYLKTVYSWDRLFESTRTLLSIHNIGYQGVFPAEVVDELGLADARGLLHQQHLDEGRVGFLETGIMYASWVSTVSETYAQEIQTDELGIGLQGLLSERSDHLVGIVNGIDPYEWNPATDPHLSHHFDADDMAGKQKSRYAVLARMGVEPAGEGTMVIGIVSRMTAQKGFELLPDILPVILQREDVRLLVLGSGEERHEQYFQWLRDTFPGKVGCYIGYLEYLAHWIEAGSDLFLMPSRYEPCGLNQMYSLAYGTLPLVRHTGGLADTVERWDPEARTGTGFVFYDYTPDALFDTLEHALDVWKDREAWEQLVRNGMAKDFSWDRQSGHYVELYRRILTE
jgi:starch synthase